MANRKVGIIEKLKREDGTWTNVPVHFPKSRTSGKGRRGKFLLVWREAGQRIYHPLPNYKDGSLTLLGDALIAKEQKEQYLASLAAGLKVEDPVESKTRLTVGAGIDEFLGNLMGHGNTVALYTYSLHQFRDWNTKHKNKKTFLDQIDRPHMLAFKKWCQEQGGKDGKPNGELTAVWKCMRMNKCIKTMLNLPAGKGPVTKGDFSEVLNRRPVVVTYTKEERVLWSLFLKCGFRYKQLSFLEWADIDWLTHVIRIRRKFVKDGDRMVELRPKKDSIRDVALPDDLYLLLKKFKNDSMCNLVFPTRSGRANTKLWDACQRIAYQAGLDTRKFKPKNFRSTYATNLLRNGYTLAEVRDQLGHRNMGSVEHIVRLLSPGPWLVGTTRVYPGVGTDIVMDQSHSKPQPQGQ